jgi:hypothetical protein
LKLVQSIGSAKKKKTRSVCVQLDDDNDDAIVAGSVLLPLR